LRPGDAYRPMVCPRAGPEVGNVVRRVDLKVAGCGRFFGFGLPVTGSSSGFCPRVVERGRVQDRRRCEADPATFLLREAGRQVPGEYRFGKLWSLLARRLLAIPPEIGRERDLLRKFLEPPVRGPATVGMKFGFTRVIRRFGRCVAGYRLRSGTNDKPEETTESTSENGLCADTCRCGPAGRAAIR
jgi:hypothetical protein